jgi:hypothetical protein
MPVTTTITPYGYRSTVVSPLTAAEARTWFDDIRRIVRTKRTYCQLIDLRSTGTHQSDTSAVIQEIMRWNMANGLQRSAIVLSGAVMKMQVSRMTRTTAAETYERFFDPSSDPNWESKAMAWLERGDDPQRHTAERPGDS